jgi:hypothetical protein
MPMMLDAVCQLIQPFENGTSRCGFLRVVVRLGYILFQERQTPFNAAFQARYPLFKAC